jgi:hypothetical protein
MVVFRPTSESSRVLHQSSPDFDEFACDVLLVALPAKFGLLSV